MIKKNHPLEGLHALVEARELNAQLVSHAQELLKAANSCTKASEDTVSKREELEDSLKKYQSKPTFFNEGWLADSCRFLERTLKEDGCAKKWRWW